MIVNRHTMLWVAAALLGIVATATVAWSASQLAASGIGLAGTPLSVTSGLAPASPSAPSHRPAPAAASRRAKPQRPAHRPVAQRTVTSGGSRAPAPIPVTPSPPASSAPAVSRTPASTTVSSTPTPSTQTPAPRRPTHNRDDSSGGGSGGRGAGGGRDD